jgi:PAS domain S-box-containing protein
MNRRNPNLAWLWLSLILVFLFVIGWNINHTHVQQSDAIHSEKSKIELDLLAHSIQDQLQKKDYDSAKTLIKDWGAGNTNILGITLTSKNGFELARYHSSLSSTFERIETTTIPYSYNSLATLSLNRSLDEAYKEKRLFLYQLLAAYLLISAAFFLLAYTNSRIRKQKQELKESQDQIRLLLDSSAEGIYGLDKENRCTFINRAALQMLDYNEDSELIGKNIQEIIFHIPSEEPPASNANGNQSSIPDNKNRSHIDGKNLWRKNNSSFTAEYWSYPIYKEEEHVGAVVTFLDITERKAAADALYKREQDLSITLDSIGDAVITTDEAGLVTRMNPVAEKLTGWPEEEAQGKTLQSVFPIVDASSREPIESPTEKVLSHGETIYLSNHTTLISRDSKEYQIADSAAPILDRDNQIKGMVLVFNDVTEQYRLREEAAKSQRTLQAIMDNSPSAIYVKDQTGRVTYANQKAGGLFGWTGQDLIGLSDHDLFPKEIADAIRGNDIKVLESGIALESEENALFDGNLRYFSSIKFPILGEDGNIVATGGVSTDITERKLQEEKLLHSQKMESLGKLTGGIAHDFNNILGIILGFTELLDNALDKQPKLHHYITQITHAGERGAKLTQRLLAFSRQETEQAKVLNINALLTADQNMLEKSLTSRITLQYKLDANLWPACIEESSFEDAMLNLCINAMHAMEQDGGRLIIETKNLQLGPIDALKLHLSAGDYVVVSIKDTGCGMDEATTERIFEPFFTTKEHKGTGLGLSQVYGFVERSKGAINVNSCLNKGSEFELYFPRHQQDKPSRA